MRRTIRAATAALMACSGAAVTARAADLSLPPIYQPEASPIVELGTGWYLRADANVYDANLNFGFGTLNDTNFGATIGAGYQFNSMFRVDATFDYMTPVTRTKTVVLEGTGAGFSLPSSAFGSLYPPGCPVASDPTIPGNLFSVSCTANPFAKVETMDVYLVNGYLDLGHWYGVTPYVGAGAGLAYVHSQTNIQYRFMSGAPYGTLGTNNYCGFQGGLGGLSCYHLGFPNNAGGNFTNYNFAFALMAGFSYDISNLLKVDVGYRYLDMGPRLSSQQFRVGLRITPDG